MYLGLKQIHELFGIESDPCIIGIGNRSTITGTGHPGSDFERLIMRP